MPSHRISPRGVTRSSSAARQIENANKALHLRSAGGFREIYEHLFEECLEIGDGRTRGRGPAHPILAAVRSGEAAVAEDDPGAMDEIIDRICTQPTFRRRLKARPLATLATLGVAMPASAEAVLEAGEADDPDLLLTAAAAQTVDVEGGELTTEPVAFGTGVAILVTIVLSGVAVAVVVVIRRRRRRQQAQTDDTIQNPGDDRSDDY